MRKDDLRSVRRPGRPGVALMSRQLDLMRAVWKDRVELRRGAIGEGAEGLEENPLAIRRPMLKPRLQFSPRCQLLQTRAVSVHHKDLAGAMCRHKREEDFGAVGRPIRVSVLVSRVRMRELPYISPISLCREDSGSALVVIQKALPGDLPVRACGDGVLSGCGSRRRGLLAWCGLPTGRQECRQQTDQQNGIHTSSHRCFSFLSFCRLLKRADEDSLGSAQENWRTRISVSANKGPSKFGCW